MDGQMEIVIGRNSETCGGLEQLINKHGGSLEIAGIQYGDALCLNGRNGFDLMAEQYRFDAGFEIKAIDKVLSWLSGLNQ
jgi:hypothetical protein